MPEAVKVLRLEERRAVMGWLSQRGPFWDDDRLHDAGDWYECAGDVVTDSAVGEAAHCLLHGIDRGLLSLAPSNFEFDPVEVDRVFGDGSRKRADISNHWEPATFENFLTAAPPALTSWTVLANHATSRFTMLSFAGNAFEPLRGQPFKQGVAERVLVLLDALQRLNRDFHFARRIRALIHQHASPHARFLHRTLRRSLLKLDVEPTRAPTFRAFLRHRSTLGPFLRHAGFVVLSPRVSLPAPAAPRSSATCRRTAVGSDALPPAGASSTWHASPAGLRFSPAAAGDS